MELFNYVTASLLIGFFLGTLNTLILHKTGEKIKYGPLKIELLVDLLEGFITAGLFIILSPSLPGDRGGVKGVIFGITLWIIKQLFPGIRSLLRKEQEIQPHLILQAVYLGKALLTGVILGLLLIIPDS